MPASLAAQSKMFDLKDPTTGEPMFEQIAITLVRAPGHVLGLNLVAYLAVSAPQVCDKCLLTDHPEQSVPLG